MRKILALWGLIFFSIMLTGCDYSSAEVDSSIAISIDQSELGIGSGGRFTVTEFQGGEIKDVSEEASYSSSDSKVIKVNQDGIYTAISSGSAEIRACFNFARDSMRVTVDLTDRVEIEIVEGSRTIHVAD